MESHGEFKQYVQSFVIVRRSSRGLLKRKLKAHTDRTIPCTIFFGGSDRKYRSCSCSSSGRTTHAFTQSISLNFDTRKTAAAALMNIIVALQVATEVN